MAKRRQHQRPQKPKSKERVGEAFTVFRPVEEDSAEELYQLMKSLHGDGLLPEQTELKDPVNMRVTYIERHRMTRQLQGFAAGFNTAEAVHGINDISTSKEEEIAVSLGKASLLNRRDQALVAHLSHSQVVAEEYQEVHEVLTSLHVPQDRRTFRPHVTLAYIGGITAAEKRSIAHDVTDVLPEDVVLSAMQTFPRSPSQRKQR